MPGCVPPRWATYTEAAIRAIEGRAVRPGTFGGFRRVNLVIDIQAKIQAGKGPAYQRWATVYNLQQMAAAVQYLQEHGLMDYAVLEQRAAEAAERFHTLSEKVKTTEAELRRNKELRAAVHDYAKTRPVFEEYKAKRYSNQFLSEHEAEISLYRTAQATFRRILAGAKLPKMDALAEAAGWPLTKRHCMPSTGPPGRYAGTGDGQGKCDRLLDCQTNRKKKEMERQRHGKTSRQAAYRKLARSGKHRHRRCEPHSRVWGGSPTSRFSDFGRRAKFEKHASVATLALLAV
ncbi:MAG: hypothetical protein ACLRXC_05705 [[Clostridium] leptum]